MLKLYILFIAASTISSCSVSVNYLGNSFERTSQVDVYVDPSAIKKAYTIIGKGYEQPGVYSRYSIEKLQQKAVEKARQKGADAVLFQDYFLTQPGAAVHTTTRTDTLVKAVISTSDTYAGPVVQERRQILFLKYN